jgi:hypothetical protein
MTTTELAIIIVGSALLALCAPHVGNWLATAWARARQQGNAVPISETVADTVDEDPVDEHADKPDTSAANAYMAELLSRTPGIGKVEPRSGMRAAGRELYGIYTSMIEAGFTPVQAMDLTRTILHGANPDGRDK